MYWRHWIIHWPPSQQAWFGILLVEMKGKCKLFSEDFGLPKVTRALFLEKMFWQFFIFQCQINIVLLCVCAAQTQFVSPSQNLHWIHREECEKMSFGVGEQSKTKTFTGTLCLFCLCAKPQPKVTGKAMSWFTTDQVSFRICIFRLWWWDIWLWRWTGVAYLTVLKSDSTWDVSVGWIS